MSIRPIDFNGMIQRTEDIGIIKHQEDTKPQVDQQNIQVQVEKNEDAAKHQVSAKEDSSGAENQADAREEGKGMYYSSDKKKKQEQGKNNPGRVIKKTMGGGFDIKI